MSQQQPPPPPGPIREYPPGPPGTYASYTASGVVEYAHWWKRVVAAIVDGVILAIANAILGFIIGFAFGISTSPTPAGQVRGEEGAIVALVNVIGLLVGILYYVLLNGSERGQTVGKIAMSIQVRDLDARGPIGYGKALVRYVVGLVLFLLCLIPGIVDLLFPLWDDKRQTLHDKAASTVVIDLTASR